METRLLQEIEKPINRTEIEWLAVKCYLTKKLENLLTNKTQCDILDLRVENNAFGIKMVLFLGENHKDDFSSYPHKIRPHQKEHKIISKNS